MKKILVSFGLILTLVLCCALVPVNAAEECAHEKVTFQYFLEGQESPTTCAESGIAKYTCDACKTAVYKKEVGKHVVDFVIVDASCTESQKVTEKCTVCKTVLKETEVTPALGHDWKETLVDASCENGAGIATKCTRCDAKKEFAAFEEGHELYAPAKGHKWADTKVVAATCKEGGYTLQTCENCKGTQKVNATEVDKENGHKSVLVSVLKEPVCKANGIGKFACELCEEELGYGSIAASHKWDYENMTVVTPATCGKNGKGTVDCLLCDAQLKDFVISNENIKHTWEAAVLSEDCTNPAKVGQICSTCGAKDLVDVEGSKPLGHSWAEAYKDATCDKASGIAKACTECDATEFVEFEEGSELYVPAKGHKEAVVKGKAATCSAEGLTDGKKCSVCNTVLVKQEKIAKNPSAHTSQLVDTLKEPGCTTLGVGKYACKDCKADLGYKSISATHNWELTKVATAATCTKEGKGTYTCSVCKATKEDKIAKAAHSYVDTTIAKCGEKVKVVEICSVCEAEGKVKSEGEVVKHNWTADTVFDATCNSKGFVGKVCLNGCGTIEVISVIEDVLGHDFAETLIEATCDKPNGVKRVCKRDYCVCEEVEYFEEGHALYVAPKGHKEKTVAAKAATCAAKGLTEGKVCEACGIVLVKQEEVAINPENHTSELVATLKAATCTTNGVGKYACKDCGEELGYKAIAAAHKLGELVVDTAATCTKEGKGHKDCSACDYVQKDIVIKKAAHNYAEMTIDADCVNPDRVGQACTVCKAEKDVKPVEGSKPLGHKLSEKYVEATCTAPSGILVECSACDYEKFTAFTAADGELYVAAKGHTEQAIKAVAPTCAKEGSTAGVECKVCKVVLVKPEKVAKDPKAHTSELVDTLKAATCTTSGVGKYACKDCKADLGYKAIAAAHKLGELVVDTAATCTKEGKGHKNCTACDYVQKDIVIKKADHSYANIVIEADCVNPDRVGKACTVCKAEKDVKPVEGSKALGHSMVEEYVAATCTSASGISAKCQREGCKEAKFTAFTAADGELYVAAKGHTEQAIKAVAPTCAKEGSTAGVECKVCKEVLVKPEKVAKDANAHTSELVATLKAETCKASGVGKYACKDCKADLGYKAIPAAHKLGELVVDTAATCGKAGKGHKNCTACDYVQKDIVIKATGKHDFKETVIDATCTEAAKAGNICTVCGAEDKNVVSVGKPNGHTWKETPVEATCTTPAGVKKVCTIEGCKATEFVAYTGELAEAAKGHKYETVVVEGTCKVAGYTAEVCKACKDVQNKVEGTKNPENHTAKADTIIKAPTCTATGVAKAVCADCGEALGYIAVPAGHSFGTDAIANESGTLVYVECEDCDTIKVVAYFGTKNVAVGTVFGSLEAFEKAEAAK